MFSFSYSRALGMGLFMTQAATHGQKPANPSSLPAAVLGLTVCLPPWWLGPGATCLPRLIPLQRGSRVWLLWWVCPLEHDPGRLVGHTPWHSQTNVPGAPWNWQAYLRTLWMRRLQSGASTFLLRVSMNFWACGSSTLPGGKRPVQSHSSCQPRSSLYLWMAAQVSPGGAPPRGRALQHCWEMGFFAGFFM